MINTRQAVQAGDTPENQHLYDHSRSSRWGN